MTQPDPGLRVVRESGVQAVAVLPELEGPLPAFELDEGLGDCRILEASFVGDDADATSFRAWTVRHLHHVIRVSQNRNVRVVGDNDDLSAFLCLA